MAVERTQLPHLFRLVDDDSARVRERVEEKLRAFGSTLAAEVRLADGALTRSQRAALQEILAKIAREAHESDVPAWLSWLKDKNPYRRLEMALGALAQWQRDTEYSNIGNSFDQSVFEQNLYEPFETGPDYSNDWMGNSLANLPWQRDEDKPLNVLLDELAREYRATGRPWHPESLSAWLFVDKGFSGNTLEYYDPQNSNLAAVIESGRGIPISLTCVFMLLGHRLGLRIEGCNFPGHFLAYARSGGEDLLFDCFDGGRLLSPFETNAIRRAEPRLLHNPAAPEEIVARTLRNLAVAYDHCGEFAKSRFMRTLLQELEAAVNK